MKRILAINVLLVFVIASLSFAEDVAIVDGDVPDIPSFVGYATDRIVVKFDPVALQMIDKQMAMRGRTGVPALDHVGMRHGAASIRALFPGAKSNGRTYKGRAIGLAGWYRVKFAQRVDALAVVEEYNAIPGVIKAEPVTIHRVYAHPHETYYDRQWHLQKIHAPDAWEIETGHPDIIVAILDTGVRYFHKDLGGASASYYADTDVDGNMWVNWAEKYGTPGEDDDGNGYVDDWIGWDFVEDTTSPFPCFPGEDCDMVDNDPRDFHGHGTHCAGNVAALNNNDYAVASVAGGWGSGRLETQGDGVKVMSLRVGWSAIYVIFEIGLVAMDSVAQAFHYAADNGARIASCSWGSEEVGYLADAIDYFLAQGGMIFKAAGNDGMDIADSDDYMCSRPDIITVAATDEYDCRAYFSNYGDSIDVSAPGVDIWSLFHYHLDPEEDYVTNMEGTSMSTPLAAAVAALIWSQDPELSADDVKQQLYGSCDPIDDLACNSVYAGKLGAGRINAFNAVSSQPPSPSREVGVVDPLQTGKYVGRGKKKRFEPGDNFDAGDEVVIRGRVMDDVGPVADAVVEITITGPEPGTILTGDPSDTDGWFVAKWKTSAPRKKRSGTTSGSYTATVTNITADGYTWDGYLTDASFIIQ